MTQFLRQVIPRKLSGGSPSPAMGSGQGRNSLLWVDAVFQSLVPCLTFSIKIYFKMFFKINIFLMNFKNESLFF